MVRKECLSLLSGVSIDLEMTPQPQNKYNILRQKSRLHMLECCFTNGFGRPPITECLARPREAHRSYVLFKRDWFHNPDGDVIVGLKQIFNMSQAFM